MEFYEVLNFNHILFGLELKHVKLV